MAWIRQALISVRFLVETLPNKGKKSIRNGNNDNDNNNNKDNEKL